MDRRITDEESEGKRKAWRCVLWLTAVGTACQHIPASPPFFDRRVKDRRGRGVGWKGRLGCVKSFFYWPTFILLHPNRTIHIFEVSFFFSFFFYVTKIWIKSHIAYFILFCPLFVSVRNFLIFRFISTINISDIQDWKN